jgi:hypothetical protein
MEQHAPLAKVVSSRGRDFVFSALVTPISTRLISAPNAVSAAEHVTRTNHHVCSVYLAQPMSTALALATAVFMRQVRTAQNVK